MKQFVMKFRKWGVTILLGGLCAGDLFAQDELEQSFYGTKEKDSPGLIAIIYDLKQTQDRQNSGVSAGDYPEVIKEFVENGWDEQVLNRFFRVTQPLYSTQVFIPGMSADVAPKAYGVDQIMQPRSWVIHYKGQVSPPEDGTYRFVGYADDFFAAAVNGKTVCVSARQDMGPDRYTWRSSERPGAHAYNGELKYGDWVEMKKGEPIDLDVLVGERPGGQFCAFLLYQKQGEEYEKDSRGHPILPVFQLVAMPIEVRDQGSVPPYKVSPELWIQHR